jgi:hypothetical protein
MEKKRSRQELFPVEMHGSMYHEPDILHRHAWYCGICSHVSLELGVSVTNSWSNVNQLSFQSDDVMSSNLNCYLQLAWIPK